MKLSELNPRWTSASWIDPKTGYEERPELPTPRHGMGCTFDCPIHRNHRLGVFFANPVDGLPPAKDEKLWNREGETFEILTLNPSLDASEFGCWHGFITSGQVQ